ncbi:MAG: hypothetical protein IKB62_09250 [Oscillospiraceae bacterium]|nr:hypothetical protein [Oscillospiraceae bacterium]
MNLSKIIRIFFILLFIAAVIIVGIMLYLKANRNRYILDGPGMINTREGEITGVTYSCSGGMEGRTEYYSIRQNDDDTAAIFEYEYCPENGAEATTETKTVSLEYFNDFRHICRETMCLINAHKGKESELILLDAPVSVISFTLENGEMITFRSDYEYPSDCDGLFSAVTDRFELILNKAEAIQ